MELLVCTYSQEVQARHSLLLQLESVYKIELTMVIGSRREILVIVQRLFHLVTGIQKTCKYAFELVNDDLFDCNKNVHIILILLKRGSLGSMTTTGNQSS